MPLLDHVTELRRRIVWSIVILVVAAVVAFLLYEPIITFLFEPFEGLSGEEDANTVYVTTVLEGFATRIRVSLLCGLIASLPAHLTNGLLFVVPGLTRRERRIVGMAVATALLLVVASLVFGYATVLPISLQFLMTSRFIPDGVGVLLSLQRNIAYLFQFLLATVVVFEIPVVLTLLMAFDVVSRRALLRASRYVVVGVFVVSAVLTPPDFVSQLALALPLIALYFLSIAVASIFRLGGH